MPFRAESSSFRAYSARKPFPFHVCTMDADGSGNKRLTEKSEEKDKTAYRLVQIGSNTICCFFIILERLFFRNTHKMGRRQTALPPEKSIRFFYDLPVSAFIRSDTLEYSFCLHLGNMLFHSFRGYAYPLGKGSCT